LLKWLGVKRYANKKQRLLRARTFAPRWKSLRPPGAERRAKTCPTIHDGRLRVHSGIGLHCNKAVRTPTFVLAACPLRLTLNP